MTKQDIFEQARKLFPGTKRGYETEFKNFKRHKDWTTTLLLLKPAIEQQIQWRKDSNGDFRPCWKHFRTWINQRCWEDEMPVAPREESTAERVAKLKAEGKWE